MDFNFKLLKHYVQSSENNLYNLFTILFSILNIENMYF